MPTSRFYYKNILKRASDGLGDGTRYATATGATVDQANKQFTLSGLSIIADLGADADNKFNGYILYFPASGNIYHIVDWTAATDVATVYETPEAGDTGACEIRKNFYSTAIYDQNNLPHRSCDGKRSTKWIVGQDNSAMVVYAYMPNFLFDGGFEEQGTGAGAAPWNSITGPKQIVDPGANMRGSRCVEYSKGTTNTFFEQNIYAQSQLIFEQGKTYCILLLARALTANPTTNDVMLVRLRQRNTGRRLDADWEGPGGDWYPNITTTETWFFSEFTPDFTSKEISFRIYGRGESGTWGSCTGFQVDEIYIWEKVTAQRLIVIGHNWDAGITGVTYAVAGIRMDYMRTNYSSGSDFVGSLATWEQYGQDPIVKTVADTVLPMYRVMAAALSDTNYEAEEIYLGPTMAFTKQMDRPFDPDSEYTAGVFNETQAGRTHYHKNFHRGGPYNLRFSNVTAAFYADLKDWWQEVGRDKFPFFFCFDEAASPEKIKLVRCLSDFLFPYDPVRRSGAIELREEL